MRPRSYPLVILAALAAGSLGACRNVPPPSAPPEQRPALVDAAHWQRIVHMDDADAPEHFIRDIDATLSATWRWSAKNPAIRIRPHTAEHLKYVVELAVPEATFRATGAVTIAFSLNGKLLDRVKYDKPGTHTFEKPVEPGWLKADEDATLSAEIDKTYLDNGTLRGFIIVSMGLANSTVPPEKP